nr:MAG TPA: hypothetical protein [Caudoviricetes sp.]
MLKTNNIGRGHSMSSSIFLIIYYYYESGLCYFKRKELI